MESRIFSLFLRSQRQLAFVLGMLLLPATAPLAADPEQVIEPEIERRAIKEADIDTEDFEIGAFAGVMNVEDFGTNPVYGVRVGYHVTEDIFVEGAWGRTDTDETSFERLSGAAQLLEDDDRTLDYYNVSFGWNILPGEAFIGSRYAFSTAFYIIGGVGYTSFAGDDEFTWNAGAGYRILANDWLAIRFDARDHVFEIDLLGEKQTNHNLEFTAGLSVFF